MKHKILFIAILALSPAIFAADQADMQQEIEQLRRQTVALQAQLNHLQKKMSSNKTHHVRSSKTTVQAKRKKSPVTRSVVSNHHAKKSVLTPIIPPESPTPAPRLTTERSAGTESQPSPFHSSVVSVHSLENKPKAAGAYPTALVADGRVITYIAGTPVVTAPYLGERPAFDGSDYIVKISSINRDLRLMQQRRKLYHAYEQIGYPDPNRPILALSGKVVPDATFNQPYYGQASGDLNLGATELDVAAALSDKVEGFIGIVYDDAPPSIGGQRVSNSAFGLSLGFINIGNLDQSPFYFTAGQLYAPFGKYSSSMISGTLPMMVARTLTRPFILGYQSQGNSGIYGEVYAYQSDTTVGNSAIPGANLGYSIDRGIYNGDLSIGYIGTLADSLGMQSNNGNYGSFGGFASPTNGSENVAHVPGIDIHGNFSIDRYNFAAEWLDATQAFRTQDLSFNGRGAWPQAGQLETSVTFKIFDKPSSVGGGYQWTRQALALNLPARRAIGVFNISLWRNTVESLEYRYDIDYGANQYSTGAVSAGQSNIPIKGTGKGSSSVTLQIGVYF